MAINSFFRKDAVNSIIRRHKIKPHWMFALDSLVRNAVQQSVNVLHPENAAPPPPLDASEHLEPYPFEVKYRNYLYIYIRNDVVPTYSGVPNR